MKCNRCDSKTEMKTVLRHHQLIVEPHILNYDQVVFWCRDCGCDTISEDQLESTRLIRENFMKVNRR